MVQRYALLSLLFISPGLACLTNFNLTTKKGKQKNGQPEGYVILEVKIFADVNK